MAATQQELDDIGFELEMLEHTLSTLVSAAKLDGTIDDEEQDSIDDMEQCIREAKRRRDALKAETGGAASNGSENGSGGAVATDSLDYTAATILEDGSDYTYAKFADGRIYIQRGPNGQKDFLVQPNSKAWNAIDALFDGESGQDETATTITGGPDDAAVCEDDSIVIEDGHDEYGPPAPKSCDSGVVDDLLEKFSAKCDQANEKLIRLHELVQSGAVPQGNYDDSCRQLGTFHGELPGVLTEIGCMEDSVAVSAAKEFLAKFDRYLENLGDYIAAIEAANSVATGADIDKDSDDSKEIREGKLRIRLTDSKGGSIEGLEIGLNDDVNAIPIRYLRTDSKGMATFSPVTRPGEYTAYIYGVERAAPLVTEKIKLSALPAGFDDTYAIAFELPLLPTEVTIEVQDTFGNGIKGVDVKVQSSSGVTNAEGKVTLTGLHVDEDGTTLSAALDFDGLSNGYTGRLDTTEDVVVTPGACNEQLFKYKLQPAGAIEIVVTNADGEIVEANVSLRDLGIVGVSTTDAAHPLILSHLPIGEVTLDIYWDGVTPTPKIPAQKVTVAQGETVECKVHITAEDRVDVSKVNEKITAWANAGAGRLSDDMVGAGIKFESWYDSRKKKYEENPKLAGFIFDLADSVLAAVSLCLPPAAPAAAVIGGVLKIVEDPVKDGLDQSKDADEMVRKLRGNLADAGAALRTSFQGFGEKLRKKDKPVWDQIALYVEGTSVKDYLQKAQDVLHGVAKVPNPDGSYYKPILKNMIRKYLVWEKTWLKAFGDLQWAIEMSMNPGDDEDIVNEAIQEAEEEVKE